MGIFGINGVLVQGGTVRDAGPRTRLETRPPLAARRPNAVTDALHFVWDTCADWLRPGRMPAEMSRRKRLRERELGVLHAAKDEFDDALWDLPAEDVCGLQLQVDAARSMHELWHLRAGVYGAVARWRDQEAAEEVLAGLNRHFPTRSARSGFMSLEDLV